jgi:hypothetical protein
VQLVVELADLMVEPLPAAGEAAQRPPRRSRGAFARAETRAALDLPLDGEMRELAVELSQGGHDSDFEAAPAVPWSAARASRMTSSA